MPRNVGVWAAMPALAKRTVIGWGTGTACAPALAGAAAGLAAAASPTEPAVLADGPPDPPLLAGADCPDPPTPGGDCAAGAAGGAAAGPLERDAAPAQALPSSTVRRAALTSCPYIVRSSRPARGAHRP